MFFDRNRVGLFATTHELFAAGDSNALHRVLVSMIMFQRRQDVQIAKILREMDRATAREIMSPRRLLTMSMQSPCPSIKSTALLHSACDLSKDNGHGTCDSHASIDCHLKRHTVALKRYGHFGKFPTSVALVFHELKIKGLQELYKITFAAQATPQARADHLQYELSRIWRVSDKIGAMFLSACANPDLGPAPWSEGVDWTKFIVIDSNVDLFLKSIGYSGSGTYAARHQFITALATAIDLRAFKGSVHHFNPRLVQQAMYLFMSSANRRTLIADCRGKGVCNSCERPLKERCPVKGAPQAS
jgi:hypothetical protein